LFNQKTLKIFGSNVIEDISIDESKKTEETLTIELSCNCVAFRFDDVQDFWLNNIQIGIIDFFVERKLPITLGIVGGGFGADKKIVDNIKNSLGLNPFIEIANHGWDHISLSSLSKEEQSLQLQQANEKLSDSLGVAPTTLIPPLNEYNDDTLAVLEENGITHISSSVLKGDLPPYPLTDSKFYRFPETATTGIFDGSINLFIGLDSDESFADVETSVNENGFAIVTMHPQEFSVIENAAYTNELNLEQVEQLELLVDKVQLAGYEIVTINSVNLDSQKTRVPEWIKNNAGWWASGQISDADFVQGIQYLIREKIMSIPETELSNGGSQEIPEWIKNNAGWWSEGLITEDDFISGIQWLIENGIMRV